MKLRLFIICTLALIVLGIAPETKGYEWTSWTSDQLEARVCDHDKFQSGMQSWGTQSDWMRLECHNPNTVSNIVDRDWTTQFTSNKAKFCPWPRYISGINTTGTNSRNISLECASAFNQKRNFCKWTKWITASSGKAGLKNLFPFGYHGVGMQCWGSNCTWQRSYICRSY